jgi:hypothetical protein
MEQVWITLGHPGTVKCFGGSVGRGRRLDTGALSPKQVWCRVRGTWDCRCEHEPQIRFLPGPSPAGRR